MSNLTLTDQERDAFHQEITRNRALDYFFVFDNVPLQFIYRDKPMPAELTDLEQRNKTITETVWLAAYHQYLVCNVPFMFTYRGRVLQMPLQIHHMGAGMFVPPEEDNSRLHATADGAQADFDAWMESEGWPMADELRKKPARGSWQNFLDTPDRTSRIVNLVPVGNQVVLELISTWTVAGTLKEAAWVVVLIYDVDGTVLQDRSYIDMTSWPSGPKYLKAREKAPQVLAQTVGVMDGFYEYQKARQIEVSHTELEKRNLSIIERAWLDAKNSDDESEIRHPQRFRTQWPLQKCSFSLDVAKEVEAAAKEAAPQKKVCLSLTYAKGSQVVAEGVICWNEAGTDREAPFISFLLLDKDGLIIRDRCYLTMDNWPGASRIKTRLGL